jgi:hypothetical protein
VFFAARATSGSGAPFPRNDDDDVVVGVVVVVDDDNDVATDGAAAAADFGASTPLLGRASTLRWNMFTTVM